MRKVVFLSLVCWGFLLLPVSSQAGKKKYEIGSAKQTCEDALVLGVLLAHDGVQEIAGGFPAFRQQLNNIYVSQRTSRLFPTENIEFKAFGPRWKKESHFILKLNSKAEGYGLLGFWKSPRRALAFISKLGDSHRPMHKQIRSLIFKFAESLDVSNADRFTFMEEAEKVLLSSRKSVAGGDRWTLHIEAPNVDTHFEISMESKFAKGLGGFEARDDEVLSLEDLSLLGNLVLSIEARASEIEESY